MKCWPAMLFLSAGLAGCNQPRQVSGPEFQREYGLRNAQTMVATKYLGEKDGKVFLSRETMSLTTRDRWNKEIWFTETNNLSPAFLAQLKAVVPASLTVILFDSPDSTHPSPRDHRWPVTDAVQATTLAGHLQSAHVIPTNGPPAPACAIVACVDLPAAGGATNRTFLHHVHFPTSVLLSRGSRHLALTNSAAFLADLARTGFPTNRLTATESAPR